MKVMAAIRCGRGNAERVSECPSSLQSRADGAAIKPSDFSPLNERMRLLTKSELLSATRPAIATLLFGCSPAAVVRRIRAVVVAAIYRMRRAWASAHVAQEDFKAIPLGTDGNPSPTVVGILSVSGIQASLSHIRKGMEFRWMQFAQYSFPSWHVHSLLVNVLIRPVQSLQRLFGPMCILT